LTDPKTTFVPFRDSKLTRLLQDSLGGNSKTSLIVTIGPSVRHIDETISSLSFGQRAMKVENKPIVNRQKDYYVSLGDLKKNIL
jgi:kinesin family member 5